MKTNKFIAFILLATMIFSALPTAFAAEENDVNENIAFLKENLNPESELLTWELPSMEKKLSNPETKTEEKEEIIKRIAELRSGMENCLSGTHTFYNGAIEDSMYHSCKVKGVCLYCDTELVRFQYGLYILHKDLDGDDICDDCKKEMPYVNCDHFCHNDNIIVKNILLPIMKLIWEILGVEEYCECGMDHAHV